MLISRAIVSTLAALPRLCTQAARHANSHAIPAIISCQTLQLGLHQVCSISDACNRTNVLNGLNPTNREA